MSNPSHAALVGPSDIADMAGVSRAAVSNWRKRYPDFPESVDGSPERPLFDRAAALEWLKANGKEVTADSGMRVWSVLNSARGTIQAHMFGELVLSIACARKLSYEAATSVDPWLGLVEAAEHEGLTALRHASPLDDARWHDLVPVGNAAASLPPHVAASILREFGNVPEGELANVADFTLTRMASGQIRFGLETGFVGSRVSRMLANLTVEGGGLIYDPACGIGASLLDTVNAITEVGGTVDRVVGHDISIEAITTCRQRAFLQGIHIDTACADVLMSDPEPELRADIIVCEPPFGTRSEVNLSDPRWAFGIPPISRSEMAWIQHCVYHLYPNGRAFVVTPEGALWRGGNEAAIRAALIKAGCVEAVFSLPGKMLPHTAIPLSLWVLCRPGEGGVPDVVRIFDASGQDAPEDDLLSWLTAQPSELPDEILRDVPMTEILATKDATLAPQHWLRPPELTTDEAARQLQDALVDLNETLSEVAQTPRPVEADAPTEPAPVVNIETLATSKLLSFKMGRKREEDLESVVVTAANVRDGVFPKATDGPVGGFNRDELTAPGDVLVTTMNTVRTLVDPTGGHLAGNGVYRLRLMSDQLTPEYLARVLRGEWNADFQTGSTIRRARVQDLEVPMLPRVAQAQFLEVLASIATLRAEAAALAERTSQVEQALLNLVRYSAGGSA